MTDTMEQTICTFCGSPITQKTGKGHPKREYCENGRCKQAAYRQRTKKHIAELETRLNVEERFNTDTRKRHFKSWLRSHPQPSDTSFFRRFLDDRDMPPEASRAMYEARFRLH